MSGQQPGGGNPRVSRGRGGAGGSRRNRNKCQACVQGNVRFCVHCLLCGSDDHRFNACPRRNNGGNNSGNNPGGLMNGNLTDGVGTNNQILSGGIGQGN